MLRRLVAKLTYAVFQPEWVEGCTCGRIDARRFEVLALEVRNLRKSVDALRTSEED